MPEIARCNKQRRDLQRGDEEHRRAVLRRSLGARPILHTADVLENADRIKLLVSNQKFALAFRRFRAAFTKVSPLASNDPLKERVKLSVAQALNT